MMTTENQSGLKPFANLVLIDPIVTEEKTAGGLYIPDEYREKSSYKTSRGRVVSLGYAAFKYGGKASADTPQIGDTVIFKVYEGSWEDGADGKKYVLIADDLIVGGVE